MEASACLSRSPSATFQIVAEEAIVIHLDSGSYFSLNRVGTEFWNMLDGLHTIQQHASALASKYQVDEARVVADLLELAHKLAAEKLVDVA